MSLQELASLALRLFVAYGREAWPFALAHGAVVCFLVVSIRTLLHETRSLNAWQPRDAGGAPAARILASFVADSERLGGRGFIVPITDYSDRLDAQIENIVDEIAERTNMLLIVGIAGTLFGIFEFASRTQAVSSGDRLAQMGSILAESIAKAFPVGFIGLVLMLVFQLALALPIARLHQAASDATRRALEHRGEVSNTLADVIAVSIGSSIALAMRPVSSLGQTVSEHLQPIVVTLGDRLEQSLALIKTQFGAIDESTRRFTDATEHLQQSATAMTQTSEQLRQVMASAPSVLARTGELQNLQHRALEQIQAAFTRDLQIASTVTQTLNDVSGAIAALPDRLVEQAAAAVAGAFEHVASRSVESWQALTATLRSEFQLQSASLVIETREEMEKVQAQVAAAATEWARLATQSETLISAPMSKALGEIAQSTEHVSEKLIAVAANLEIVEGRLATLPKDVIEQTASAIGPAFATVAYRSVETWRELVNQIAMRLQNDLSAYVSRSDEEVSKATEKLTLAGEEMRRLAENATSYLTEPMKIAIQTARAEATGALANLDDFIRQSYPALKSDMDRFAAELRAATETLAKTGERMRNLNAQTTAGSQDAVVAELRKVNERLERLQRKPFPWRRLLPHQWFDR